MLAVRIIPTLLYRGTTLVKGQRFAGDRSVGHVQQAARIHATRGVDELIMLDIGATPEQRGPDIELVRQMTAHTFTPVTIGGGISTTSHVEALLSAGADKVSIKTAWLASPAFLRILANRYGSQAICVAIDYRAGEEAVAAHRAARAEDLGAGEILLTAMDREGTLSGYDVRTIEHVAHHRSIPVIAHGGCGSYDHMAEAIQAGASAVAAGAMFQFCDATPRGAAEYLSKRGIEVRL
jgi:imidazole glycerol-phosphate synthase subunit HisF